MIGEIEDYIDAAIERRRQRREQEREQRDAEQHRQLELANERTQAVRRLADERARSEMTERSLRHEAEGSAKKAQERLVLASVAAGLVLLVAFVAAGAAWIAFLQKSVADKQTLAAKEQAAIAKDQKAVAEEQRALAERQKAVAEKQTALAIHNETKRFARLSREAAHEGRALDGVELALAAWPRGAGAQQPMLGDAIRYLSLSFFEHPPVAVMNPEGGATGARYSPDGKRILSWSSDHNTLRQWDAATGAAIGEPLRYDEAIYSPDGKRILSWSVDETLRLWDAKKGTAIAVLTGHRDVVAGAAFSQDSKRILSWSKDKTLRLWNAATGAAIGEPMRHEDGVRGALYSPDGKRILSWSDDKTLRQ